MQKLFHRWQGLQERGRFVLAFIYALLVALALIVSAGAPYAGGGH